MYSITTILKVFLLVGLFSCYSQFPSKAKGKSVSISDSLVDYAKTFVGVPYKWSGNNPEGFDCSGFVSYVYAHFDISLPRSSVDYDPIGVPIQLDSCRKGDIMLFSGTDNNLSRIGHVGIVISNPGEPLCFIHSSSSNKHRGVIISEFKGTGYVNRFIGIRRLLQ